MGADVVGGGGAGVDQGWSSPLALATICVVYCFCFKILSTLSPLALATICVVEKCKDKMIKRIIIRKKGTWWTSSLSCHWSDGRQKAVTDTAEAEKIIITIDQHNMITTIIIITIDQHNMVTTIIIITIDEHNMIPTIIVITIDQKIESHCQRHDRPKALSTLSRSTLLVQSRNFEKLWYLGQTSV